MTPASGALKPAEIAAATPQPIKMSGVIFRLKYFLINKTPFSKMLMILKRILFSFSFFLLFSCQNFGQLKMLGDLPNTLKEVSGNEFLPQTKAFWVLEDGGNSSKIYQLSTKGEKA